MDLLMFRPPLDILGTRQRQAVQVPFPNGDVEAVALGTDHSLGAQL